MADFPLGGTNADYDSKKGRAQVVNLIPEGQGEFKSARRTEGLTDFATFALGPVRSDLLVNGGFIYVVSGSNLYRVDEAGTVTSLGTVNGSSYAKLAANAVPGDSQILILNGSGSGYIYDNANGLVAITDPDFFPSSSVTVLNERFWLARDGTNEFFGSDISDGKSYNALTFASAEESPDEVVGVMAKKSALHVVGSRTSGYYQTFTDITLPLRRVKSATKEWGILAKDSLAEINDSFAFLANDRTVRMMRGTQLIKISDLNFDLKINGNGTTTSPGFTVINDAIGFFVDTPIHSTYYITFPTEGYTWGYDLNTGLSHIRESDGFGLWRVNGAVKFAGEVICGDSAEGKLWILDQDNKTENGIILRTKLITPTVSYERDVTIPLIEIDMEVAQTTDATADPKMIVYYTKDGGNTYTHKGHISLGKFGEHRKRVPLRRFGRLVRNKDFGLKLEVTDPVGVRFYGAKIYPRMGM
jgi:hypothetical protein